MIALWQRKLTATWSTVAEVRGLDGEIHPYLSTNADENTASIAAQALWDAHGGQGGVDLKVYKGCRCSPAWAVLLPRRLPASLQLMHCLTKPLAIESLLPYALEGEKYASGGLHADNVAPSLLGGLILCPQILLPDVVRLQVPADVSAVLIHPDLQVNTAQASRKSLKKGIPMQTMA